MVNPRNRRRKQAAKTRNTRNGNSGQRTVVLTAGIRTVTLNRVRMKDVKLLADGSVVITPIQGSNIHELSRVLSDAVEWRVRSAVVSMAPIVNRDSMGAVSTVICPAETFSGSDAIRDGGGQSKNIGFGVHTSNLVFSCDDWFNHANRAAVMCSALQGSGADITMVCTVNLTVQLRGRR